MKLAGRYAALLIVLGAIGTYLSLGVYEVAPDEAVAQQAPRVHQVLLLTLLGIFRSSRSSSRALMPSARSTTALVLAESG